MLPIFPPKIFSIFSINFSCVPDGIVAPAAFLWPPASPSSSFTVCINISLRFKFASLGDLADIFISPSSVYANPNIGLLLSSKLELKSMEQIVPIIVSLILSSARTK